MAASSPVGASSPASSPSPNRLSTRLHLDINDLASLAYQVNGGQLFTKIRVHHRWKSRGVFSLGMFLSSKGQPRWFYLVWSGSADDWRIVYASKRMHIDQTHLKKSKKCFFLRDVLDISLLEGSERVRQYEDTNQLKRRMSVSFGGSASKKANPASEPRYLKIEFVDSVLLLSDHDTDRSRFAHHNNNPDDNHDVLTCWMDALFSLIYLRSEANLDSVTLANIKSQYIKSNGLPYEAPPPHSQPLRDRDGEGGLSLFKRFSIFSPKSNSTSSADSSNNSRNSHSSSRVSISRTNLISSTLSGSGDSPRGSLFEARRSITGSWPTQPNQLSLSSSSSSSGQSKQVQEQELDSNIHTPPSYEDATNSPSTSQLKLNAINTIEHRVRSPSYVLSHSLSPQTTNAMFKRLSLRRSLPLNLDEIKAFEEEIDIVVPVVQSSQLSGGIGRRGTARPLSGLGMGLGMDLYDTDEDQEDVNVIEYDEDGNVIEYDEDGNVIEYDEDGNAIEYDEDGNIIEYEYEFDEEEDREEVVEKEEENEEEYDRGDSAAAIVTSIPALASSTVANSAESSSSSVQAVAPLDRLLVRSDTLLKKNTFSLPMPPPPPPPLAAIRSARAADLSLNLDSVDLPSSAVGPHLCGCVNDIPVVLYVAASGTVYTMSAGNESSMYLIIEQRLEKVKVKIVLEDVVKAEIATMPGGPLGAIAVRIYVDCSRFMCGWVTVSLPTPVTGVGLDSADWSAQLFLNHLRQCIIDNCPGRRDHCSGQ